MGKIFIKPWLIGYQTTATRAAYEKIHAGGPEECGCEHCHNFVLARDRIYPPEAETLFAMVGIDFRKETEVVHLRRIKPGLHQYSGSFYFVGDVENTQDIRSDSITYMAVSSNFSWQFKNCQDPIHGAFHNQPLVQIEFIAKVPWLAASCEPEQDAFETGHSYEVSNYRVML
jgi:hypothetical protein